MFNSCWGLYSHTAGFAAVRAQGLLQLVVLVACLCLSLAAAPDNSSIGAVIRRRYDPALINLTAVPPVTCRLLLEGSDNATEVELRGTSVARAELECKGGTIKIAVHPLLAPFVAGFTGVDIAPIPTWEELQSESRALEELSAEDTFTSSHTRCGSEDVYLIVVCAPSWALFDQVRITNLKTSEEWREKHGMMTAIGVRTIKPLHFVDPVFRDLNMAAIDGGNMHFVGGVVHNTRGVQLQGVGSFTRTRFTSNQSPSAAYAGAVSVMGTAELVECVFESNTAESPSSFDDMTRQQEHIVPFGGAVLAESLAGSGPRLKNLNIHTTMRLAGCLFATNMAGQGGAIAAFDCDTSIVGCSFEGNSAPDGPDVYANAGAKLRLSGSNIHLGSPTVLWVRTSASDCMRGEYFNAREGVCRWCAPSTFSLSTPTNTCQPCPANAEVSC